MLIEKINKYLTEEEKITDKSISYEVSLLSQWAFERQFCNNEEPASKGKLRLSAAGQCPRKLAYAYHGIEKNGKEIDGRRRLTFFAGDVSEITITLLAKLALKKYGGGVLLATGREQATVKFKVNGIEIEGHPDGIFWDFQKGRLLECKSMSDYSFRELEKGEISEEYLAQDNCYLDALNFGECIHIGYNKNNSIMFEKIVKRDPKVVEECKKNLLSVLISTPEKLPEPKYPEPDEKGFCSWRCLYCPWWGICKPDAEKVLIGKAYKLRPKKQPQVLIPTTKEEPENKPKEQTISPVQQRAIPIGLKKYNIKSKVFMEWLEFNYQIKTIGEIPESKYAEICDWIRDTGTILSDHKEELIKTK